MFLLFSRISTWLFIEIIATLILAILNMIIPILMTFASYRNVANFYFSSTALSSSLINCLYLFYLIQTIRSTTLSENNCRTFYYLQTSCIVVLAYTITAMHANFVLCLFPSSPEEDHPTRRCFPSCARYLRRFFRSFCFCFVLCIWSVSFTCTVPLLYTIDSNEKSPKPVYCPGTTEISYLEEWFDRNRIIQTIICNLIPLLICLFLSIIALSKLFYDSLVYFYFRLKTSQCFLFRNQSLPSNVPIQSYRRWFATSCLRFILVSSCCLLACIYPIVMRFYLIYFSVLIPLIFAAFNYSLTLIEPTTTTIEDQDNMLTTSPIVQENSLNINSNKILQTNDPSNEQFELQTPVIAKPLNKDDEPSASASISSITFSTPHQHHRPSKKKKRNYFANHLYENTRNMSIS